MNKVIAYGLIVFGLLGLIFVFSGAALAQDHLVVSGSAPWGVTINDEGTEARAFQFGKQVGYEERNTDEKYLRGDGVQRIRAFGHKLDNGIIQWDRLEYFDSNGVLLDSVRIEGPKFADVVRVLNENFTEVLKRTKK